MLRTICLVTQIVERREGVERQGNIVLCITAGMAAAIVVLSAVFVLVL